MSRQPEGPFSLVIPREASHLATARLFISSLGRSLGLHAEVVDDLKLAVSEAVGAAVREGSGDSVTISGQIDPGGVTVRVESLTGPTPPGGSQPDYPGFDLTSIVRALFAGAEFDERGMTIRVSWRPPT